MNIIDCVTFNEIPQDRIIELTDRGKKYYFDIETIHSLLREGKKSNPYTGNEFPANILSKVKEYFSSSLQVPVEICYPKDSENGDSQIIKKEIKVDSSLKLGEVILEIFRSIYGNVLACFQYDVTIDIQDEEILKKLPSPSKNLSTSIYKSDILTQFSSLKQFIFNLVYLDMNDPICRYRIGIIYPSLYRFGVDSNIEWILTENKLLHYKKLPDILNNEDNTNNEISSFEAALEMLNDGIELEMIQDHLEYLSIKTKITALQCRTLINKYEKCAYLIHKYIYPCISDKYNLNLDSVEGKYYQNIYQCISYNDDEDNDETIDDDDDVSDDTNSSHVPIYDQFIDPVLESNDAARQLLIRLLLMNMFPDTSES
jgi:hypothetical protein